MMELATPGPIYRPWCHYRPSECSGNAITVA